MHLPTEAAANAQLERLCAPMWAGVAAALASHNGHSYGNGNGSGSGEDGGDDDVVTRELRALATVVQAAGGVGAGGVGSLMACFLARGEGVRGLLAHESHGRQAWTRGAMALTASLLRALGQAVSAAEKGAGAGTDAAARMALLEVGMVGLGLYRCAASRMLVSDSPRFDAIIPNRPTASASRGGRRRCSTSCPPPQPPPPPPP